MARRKVSKSAQIIFNNQQRLVVVLAGSRGVAQMRWKAIRTNDHGGRDMPSLNVIVRVQRQGYRGTTIVGGIAYPRVVVAGVRVLMVAGFAAGISVWRQ
jgi:hypothetical protein